MSDFISRQAAVDALRESRLARNPVYMTTAMQVIEKLPSAQPEIEERTEESAQNVPIEDLISRKAAIDALDCINGTEEVLRSLPSAQPDGWLEQNKDKILQAGMEGREIDFRIGGRLFAIREKAQ